MEKKRKTIKTYGKGVRLERKIVNEARAKGYIAFRSAGSHSPVDCVIIDTKSREIRFIQAKKGKSKMTKEEKEKFLNYSDEYWVKFKCIEEK